MVGGAVAVALVVLLLASVKAYRVPASSMEPTLHCARPGAGCEAAHSDRVIALRYRWPFRGPRRGDLAVFRTTRRAAATCGVAGTYIKRVIGLPGETVAERAGGILVDGRRLREPYVKRHDEESQQPRRVPADSYYVLGDARAQSCDSRVWGPVPRRNLIGRVVATYWPPSRVALR